MAFVSLIAMGRSTSCVCTVGGLFVLMRDGEACVWLSSMAGENRGGEKYASYAYPMQVSCRSPRHAQRKGSLTVPSYL